jgi:hypothetical protein
MAARRSTELTRFYSYTILIGYVGLPNFNELENFHPDLRLDNL